MGGCPLFGDTGGTGSELMEGTGNGLAEGDWKGFGDCSNAGWNPAGTGAGAG